MPSPDPVIRVLVARNASLTRWAHEPDPRAATAAARAAFRSKFEDAVDPDRVLDEGERAKRADRLRRAHYTRLALRSAQSRRRGADAPDAT